MEQRFNILIDPPPVTALVNGHEYRVQSDFRTALGYLRLLRDQDKPEEEKAIYGLYLFFGNDVQQDDVAGLFEYIAWYMRRGRPVQDEASKKPRTFDLLQDSGRVYAAFLQVYGINLRHARIHWWVFCELLEGLPKGTHLSDVIDIRGRKPESWMKPGDKNELARAQKYYRLEDEQEEDVIGGLFDSLAGMAG